MKQIQYNEPNGSSYHHLENEMGLAHFLSKEIQQNAEENQI